MASSADALAVDPTSSQLTASDVTLTSADFYFDSNAHFGVHEELLKDRVRMNAWKKAILQNKHLFADKTVLDVGAGTGVLSMMAAKAGARHVYALESTGIYHQAVKIVKANGFDKVITLINSTVEEAVLPIEKVDIIMCDWLGYSLLYDSNIDAFIKARDKWLAPNGLLFPDKATIYVVAIEDGEYRDQKIEFWENVYGFKMSIIKEDALSEPLIDIAESNQLISNAYPALDFDLNTITLDKLQECTGRFEVLTTNIPKEGEWCHALLAYFNVQFSKTHTGIRFSTGPRAEWTHWKQTVFYLPKPIKVKNQQRLFGVFKMTRGKTRKELDFEISIRSETQAPSATQTKQYKLR